jgi:hypothetical protein
MEIHCLYWNNTNPRMVAAHKSVIDKFELPVTYTERTIRHGLWMTLIMEESKADVVGFLDIDCVPTNREIVYDSALYALNSNSFIGNAQVTNCVAPATHVFAAPSFLFISRDCWLKLNRPSFLETPRSDVAEEISYLADEQHITYRALYPTHFESIPQEGAWRLNNYGHFGIGTLFEGGIYHLFQGRLENNLLLFEKRCAQIVDANFSTDGFFNARSFTPADAKGTS